MEEKIKHSLTIIDRKNIQITGVSEVDVVTEEKITLTLFNKSRLIIYGNALKIACFSKQNGSLQADGNVYKTEYSAERISIIKKLLK